MRFPTKFPVCRSVLAGWILLALPAAAHAALPVPVNSYAPQDSGNDWVSRRPSASDGQGHWVTVWIDGDQRRILASTSADNGATWIQPSVPNRILVTGAPETLSSPPVPAAFSAALVSNGHGRFLGVFTFAFSATFHAQDGLSLGADLDLLSLAVDIAPAPG